MDVFDIRNPADPGNVLVSIDTSGNITVNNGVLRGSNGVLLLDFSGNAITVGNQAPGGTGGTVFIAQAAASNALAIEVPGDTLNRFVVRGSGNVEWGSGSATRDVTLARTAANLLTLTTADLAIGTAGRGLQVKEGANARMGTLVLTGATPVVVANTSVTANTRIFLTANAPGGTPGHFWVSARSAGTSFSVTGTAGDTSTVAYLLVEPSA